MSLLRFTWIRIVYSLYFSASVVFAALAISRDSTGGPVYVAALILALIHLAAYLTLFNMGNERIFPVVYSISAAIIIGSIIAAGIVIHPDFYRSAFHATAQLFMISIYQRDSLYRTRTGKDQIRVLYYATLAIAFLGFMWVMMMGVSGVIFGDQTTRNWMVFNFYSAGTIILAIDPILALKERLNIQFRVTESGVMVDGKDYSRLLGEKDIAVLRVFLTSPGYRANCSRILAALDDAPPNCRECLEMRSKATLCPAYKRLYNQIHKIKKFLETLQLATILPPENKRDIIVDGWSLHLFSNVHVKVHMD